MQIAHITATLTDDGLNVHVTGQVNVNGGPAEDGAVLDYTTDILSAQAMFGMAAAMAGITL